MANHFMKIKITFIFIIVFILTSFAVYAEDSWITIKGKVDPTLTKIVFANSAKIDPAIFENDHHAVNKCYKIRNGYLTFIESGEGTFEGYELSKHRPGELADKALAPNDEQAENQAGIYLGMPRLDVEKIVKRTLPSAENRILYESVDMIKDMPFDVMTSLIIGFDGNRLSRFTVITSITN